MDRYAMNRNDIRYRNQRSYPASNMPPRNYNSSPCNSCTDTTCDFYDHVDHLPLAMAYVPMQKYVSLFDPCKALQLGTAFPQLCKPFCGKRGGCK